MVDITRRLAALSKEKRELLELRLKQQGISVAEKEAAAVAIAAQKQSEPIVEEDPDEWRRKRVEDGIDFTLYFFSDDGTKTDGDKYQLVMESAKYADANGFLAVWTPERHFQDFGGLYPNPSVLGAALAAVTEQVEIRAGSVALPLHHPIRVAEEWAVVDNLSRGRAAVSFASGWHPDDFVFFPNNYDNRKDVMFSHIETIKKLWAGESVRFQSTGEREVEVKVFPRPIQPALPIWITTAGNTQTWIKAGEIGANILAALIGYSIEDLSKKIALYRETLEKNNHDPEMGRVTLMAHTFVGEDNRKIKELVREPLCHYLRSYFNQFEFAMANSDNITEEDKKVIISKAFEQYFETSMLIGTPNKCARLLDRLIEAGADEVACLIDFGLESSVVMEGLHKLNELRSHYTHNLKGEERTTKTRRGDPVGRPHAEDATCLVK
jgi:natural product biosynthesis luciferase-like monooxygenase protein